METREYPEFVIGDTIIAKIPGAYNITKDKAYIALDIYLKHDEWFVHFVNDEGVLETCYAARFIAGAIDSVTPIVAKIRAMDRRRKSLGYKW